MHHPLPTFVRNETLNAPNPDFISTLLKYKSNIQAVISGHYHRCPPGGGEGALGQRQLCQDCQTDG